MGVVIMFIGFTGKAFNKDVTVELAPGDHLQLGHYLLQVNGFTEGKDDNKTWQRMEVAVAKDGKNIGVLEPERRLYTGTNPPQPAAEVAIRRRLNEDLYLNFASMSDDGKRGVVQAYVFPLVTWIWIGYYVVLFGTLICLVPSKSRLIYPRMEVVGIAGTHAKVED